MFDLYGKTRPQEGHWDFYSVKLPVLLLIKGLATLSSLLLGRQYITDLCFSNTSKLKRRSNV